MSHPPRFPLTKTGDNEYVHIRSLVANIHKPKNVSRPPPVAPVISVDAGPKLDVVRESPGSSDSDRSRADSEKSEVAVEEMTPAPRAKSNSIATLGPSLMPPEPKRRRASFLHLHIGGGGAEHAGPLSAGAHLSVPRLSVTAPPGEVRRISHGFSAFHGFALRRHSNTVCECLQV